MAFVYSHHSRAMWLASDTYDRMSDALELADEALKAKTHNDPETAAELGLRFRIVDMMQRQVEIHTRVAALGDLTEGSAEDSPE